MDTKALMRRHMQMLVDIGLLRKTFAKPVTTHGASWITRFLDPKESTVLDSDSLDGFYVFVDSLAEAVQQIQRERKGGQPAPRAPAGEQSA